MKSKFEVLEIIFAEDMYVLTLRDLWFDLIIQINVSGDNDDDIKKGDIIYLKIEKEET